MQWHIKNFPNGIQTSLFPGHQEQNHCINSGTSKHDSYLLFRHNFYLLFRLPYCLHFFGGPLAVATLVCSRPHVLFFCRNSMWLVIAIGFLLLTVRLKLKISYNVKHIGLQARGAAAPLTRTKAKFFGQKPSSQKWKKKYFFVFIKRKKRNSFRLAR